VHVNGACTQISKYFHKKYFFPHYHPIGWGGKSFLWRHFDVCLNAPLKCVENLPLGAEIQFGDPSLEIPPFS